MLHKRTAGPAVEPVTLADAKAHLRVLHDSENTAIERFVRSAREHIEGVSGRSLITQTWKLWLPCFPREGTIVLPRPPLQSVTAVRYVDSDGATQTLAGTNYHVLSEGLFGRIERKASVAWPATDKQPKAVEIEYVAGYGSAADDVPADLVNSILLLAEHLYYNRGETTDEPLTRNPVAVDALLAKHKTHGWI